MKQRVNHQNDVYALEKYTIKWVTVIVRKTLKNLLMMDPP